MPAKTQTAADRLRDAEATQTLERVDTSRPLEQRANADGAALTRELDDVAAGVIDRHVKTLAKLAELRRAETQRHARKTADLHALFSLAGLLAEATDEIAALDVVGEELKARVLEQATAWANGGAA